MEDIFVEYDEKQLKRYCASGDIPGLLDYLKDIPEQLDLYNRYLSTYHQDPPLFKYPTDNETLKEILKGYYLYYVYVFGQGHTPKEGELYLLHYFQKMLNLPFIKRFDTLEKLIKRMVKNEGFQFLGGTTSAYYGPYIWKTTEKNIYHVQIPAKTIHVPVYFMKEFISNSWLSFLSFNITGTGGWTKRKGLFCKWDSYDGKLDLPSFQISFLKHEAQHLFDFHRYGRKLSQTTLEYRAKLCELCYYTTSDLFEQFLNTAKDDSNYAHSQAEYFIVSDLSKAIFKEDYVTDVNRWRERYSEVAIHCKTFLLENNRLK
jgi:hypothetical protein